MKKKSKQVNEIVAYPGYEGQDIYLKDYGSDCDDSSSDEDSNSSHVTVIVGTVTSEEKMDGADSYLNRLYATVCINDKRKMKIDTGADTCILTVDDLQMLGITAEIT